MHDDDSVHLRRSEPSLKGVMLSRV